MQGFSAEGDSRHNRHGRAAATVVVEPGREAVLPDRQGRHATAQPLGRVEEDVVDSGLRTVDPHSQEQRPRFVSPADIDGDLDF